MKKIIIILILLLSGCSSEIVLNEKEYTEYLGQRSYLTTIQKLEKKKEDELDELEKSYHLMTTTNRFYSNHVDVHYPNDEIDERYVGIYKMEDGDTYYQLYASGLYLKICATAEQLSFEDGTYQVDKGNLYLLSNKSHNEEIWLASNQGYRLNGVYLQKQGVSES